MATAAGSAHAYEQIKQLGKGAFGSVYLVSERSTRRSWVMKRVALKGMNTRERQAAFQESRLLQRLRHPHICSYQDSFVDKQKNELCVVMTFCPGGDLHGQVKDHQRRRKPVEEAQVAEWLLQLTLALQYIHQRHIIHRDLKTQNVFLMADRSLKLGDFGVSRVLTSPTELAKTCVGTPYYMCPELMRRQRYSNKADMWALGCVVYELTTLRRIVKVAVLARP